MVENAYGTSGESDLRVVRQVWKGRVGEGRESTCAWDEDPVDASSQPLAIRGATVKMLVTETVHLDGDTSLKTIKYYLDASGRELREEHQVGSEHFITEKVFDSLGRMTDMYVMYDPDGSSETTKLQYKYCYQTGLAINGMTVTQSGDARDHVTYTLVSDGSSWRQLAHYEYGHHDVDDPKWNHLVTKKEVFTEATSGALATYYYYDNDEDQTGTLTYGLLTKVKSPQVTSGLDSGAGQAAYNMIQKFTYYAPGQGSPADDNQLCYEETYKYQNGSETLYSRTEYVYHTTGDGKGRVSQVTVDTAGAALKTAYTYDAAGNINTVTVDPDDGQGDAELALTTDYDYDPWGNLIRATSPEGYVTEYTRNASGAATKVAGKDASSNLLSQVEYARDVYGDITQTRSLFGASDTDANKSVTEVRKNFGGAALVVDTLGDTRTDVSSTDHRAGIQAEFGARGLVEKTYVTDWTVNGSSYELLSANKWQTGELVYDWAGRVVEAKAFKDDGSGQRSTNPSEKIVNTYDSWGRLVKVVAWKEDSGGTLRAMTRTEYTYDNLNRVTRTIVLEKDTDSPTASDYLAVTRSLYDELGRVYEAQGVNPAADIDDPTDAAAVNGYVFHDEYGRVWKTRDDEGNETVRTYDTAGRAVQAEDAAGNKVSYSYDAASRVWCVKSEEKVATGVYDTSYVYTWYDDEGRVVATADYGVKTSGHPISYSTYAATNPATLVSDADKRVVRYGYGFDATEGKEYVETTGYQGDATTPTAVTTRSYSDKLGRTVRADEDRTNLSRVTTY
ncbi:MAG: RHS repeat protein, partial [Phycisphaerae bacterium]|nr:RHS repeat protein [Phycisphaerae bacterium]